MLSISEIKTNYIEIAKNKVNDSLVNNILLSILSGIFIAFAGVGYTFATSFANKFVGACVFPAGIIMVVLCGAKLFTGDCMLTFPLLKKEIPLSKTALTMLIIYLGNFIGSIIIAIMMVYSGSLDSIKEMVINIASTKSQLPFYQSFLKGILCNVLVCVAIWMSFSTHSVTGKIIAMFFPILVFVLAGFEHSIANMYFLPAGIFTSLKYNIGNLDIMLNGLYLNLIPVTIGNVVGGSLVAIIFLFIKDKKNNGI